jgi:hypothetical protein
MANPGTFDTYDAAGMREDLIDIVYDISPTETPFTMMAARGKATATLHQWQTDSLAAAAANAAIEGDNPTGNNARATTQLTNRTQISTKVVKVSDTIEFTDRAGRDKEMSFQIMKRLKELKRDVEFILCGNQALSSPAGGSETVARLTASLEAWIITNPAASMASSLGAGDKALGVNGLPGVITNGAISSAAAEGTLRAFNEAQFKDGISRCWDGGGDPSVVLTGAAQKVALSQFAGMNNTTKMDKTEDMTLFAAFDVYVSDFGKHKIVPSRFLRRTSGRDRNVFLLDPSFWEVAYLRPYEQKPLAKTGDNETRMLTVEYSLVARNEASSSKVADLS